MKILENLVTVVKGLSNIVSEPIRLLIANRISGAISMSLEDNSIWLEEGHKAFMAKCLVDCESLEIAPMQLSQFIDKWTNVELFRSEGGEWEPVTGDMRSIIHTMIEELKEI